MSEWKFKLYWRDANGHTTVGIHTSSTEAFEEASCLYEQGLELLGLDNWEDSETLCAADELTAIAKRIYEKRQGKNEEMLVITGDEHNIPNWGSW